MRLINPPQSVSFLILHGHPRSLLVTEVSNVEACGRNARGRGRGAFNLNLSLAEETVVNNQDDQAIERVTTRLSVDFAQLGNDVRNAARDFTALVNAVPATYTNQNGAIWGSNVVWTGPNQQTLQDVTTQNQQNLDNLSTAYVARIRTLAKAFSEKALSDIGTYEMLV
jgi:hypothetical protein